MTEDMQAMTLRLPRPVHEQLRRLAFETRKPMNDIAVEAISNAIEKETQNAAHDSGH